MAYLGNQPKAGNYQKIDDVSGSFDGITKQFNLTSSGATIYPGLEASTLIGIGGILQEAGVAYTIALDVITFAEAPQAGETFYGVNLGDVLSIGVPSDGTITAAKLKDELLQSDNYTFTTQTPTASHTQAIVFGTEFLVVPNITCSVSSDVTPTMVFVDSATTTGFTIKIVNFDNTTTFDPVGITAYWIATTK